MSSSGVGSSKTTTASTAARAASTRPRSLSPTIGRLGPLSAAHGSIAVDGHNEAVAEAARLLEHRDVADVQQVEAAVGKNDALAIRFPQRDAAHQFLARNHLSSACSAICGLSAASSSCFPRARCRPCRRRFQRPHWPAPTAVSGFSPEARQRASTAITVSPAPETSKTWRATAGAIEVGCRAAPAQFPSRSAWQTGIRDRTPSPWLRLRSKNADRRGPDPCRLVLERRAAAASSPRLGQIVVAPR